MDPIVEGFARLLARDPAAPVCIGGGRTLDRCGLDALARSFAATLQDHAGRNGGRRARTAAPPIVGLAATGPAFLAGLLALRRTGAVPLLLDPTTPAATLARSAAKLGAGAILHAPEPWRGAADVTPLRGHAAARAACPPAAGVLKLTSGSTGLPRAIAQTSAALLADVDQLWHTMRLQPRDRALAAIPLSFSYGLSSLAVPALTHELVLLVPGSDGPRAPLAAARADQATFLPATPALVQVIAKLRRGSLPASLRLVTSAGAPLAAVAARRFRERHGLPVHAFYGASECGGICFDRGGDAAERGTLGTPVAGVEVELAGADQLVTVRSAAVALRYLPDADATLDGRRFVTSDCGRFEGAELRLLGRTVELINVDGRKVHPREIEGVLTQLHGVDEALVVAESHDGCKSDSGHAIVACAAGALSASQVLAWCRAHLPDYKVPRRVSLVRAIPKDSRGKVDRQSLAQWCPA